MVIIESGIPIPEKKSLRHSVGLASALKAMALGDSVLIADRNHVNKLKALTSKTTIKLVQRQVDGGTRVWRVA